jgi:hypothetical protein
MEGGEKLVRDVLHLILEKRVEDIKKESGKTARRKQWKEFVKLSTVCKEWSRLVGTCQKRGIGSCWADLSGRLKFVIISKVVDDVCIKKGIVSFEEQELQCKKIVSCSTVNREWCMLVKLSTEGREMRFGHIAM